MSFFDFSYYLLIGFPVVLYIIRKDKLCPYGVRWWDCLIGVILWLLLWSAWPAVTVAFLIRRLEKSHD
ncbi:MAG: hypothetical protein RLZZ490_1477 [Cyanobacteriota bacterium]